MRDFANGPDTAACMYITGIEPFLNKPVNTAKNLNDRKLQRALIPFVKPENDFAVREALIKAGRSDLIGGCEGLIPANPPKEVLEKRRQETNGAARGDGDYDHTIANPAKGRSPASAGPGR